MIPKIIHLCWFSGKLPPLKIIRCLLSWKIYFPDYKIMLWNKQRALAANIPFVKEAIEQRKWAFAADALRLYAVYHFGGIYLDSDILIKRRFTKLLSHDNVFFSEKWPDRLDYEREHPELTDDELWGQEIQAACFAAKKGSPVIKHLLDHYLAAHFVLPDGQLNMHPIAPQIFAQRLQYFGYRYTDDEQQLMHDTIVYPSRFVAVHPLHQSSENVAIHRCMQSWKK